MGENEIRSDGGYFSKHSKDREGKWVYMKKADMKLLKEAARRRGMTASSFIRMVLLEYLAHNNKPK